VRYPSGIEWRTAWHTEKKNAPEGAFLLGFWRSRRDSNPRWAINPHTLSRRAT
jgi:hypothetical protein